MAYATIEDVEAGFRTLDTSEQTVVSQLLEEAAVIIDAYSPSAEEEAKKLVSCRMVRRSIGDASGIVPIGATQGSMSGLGYTQSWTIGSGGSSGELYLGRVDKILLGRGNTIGSGGPLEGMVRQDA